MIIKIKNYSDREKVINLLVENEIEYEKDDYICDFFYKKQVEEYLYDHMDDLTEDIDNELLKEVIEEVMAYNGDQILDAAISRLNSCNGLSDYMSESIAEHTTAAMKKVLKTQKETIKEKMLETIEEDIDNLIRFL